MYTHLDTGNTIPITHSVRNIQRNENSHRILHFRDSDPHFPGTTSPEDGSLNVDPPKTTI